MITGVQLITGLIGSGKTLRAVGLIKKEVASGRLVFVSNINGLNIPGVVPFLDPKKWQELPPGSLLVVDEAQRYWRARRTGEPPEEVQAMETSRHDSVSFLLLTQQPTYLDKHLRGLITRHEHLYRRMNLPSAQMFSWDRCVDDPQNSADKDAADKSVFMYPKEDFGSYTSAETHTVKVRLGTRAKLIIAAVLVVLVAVGYLFHAFSGVGADPGATASVARPRNEAARAAARGEQTAESYLASMLPRLASAPWSAPIYDGRRAASEPVISCMASAAGPDANGVEKSASCTCLTEQGTRYQTSNNPAIAETVCRELARHGAMYNPFLEPSRDDGNRGRDQERGRARSRSTGQGAPVAISLEGAPFGSSEVLQ